jgi:hypothetical protein
MRRHFPDDGSGLGWLLFLFAVVLLAMGLASLQAALAPHGFAP